MNHALLASACAARSVGTIMSISTGGHDSPRRIFPSHDQFLDHAAARYCSIARRLRETPDVLPRSFQNGAYDLVPPTDWTSGFFPGCLWLLHEHTRSDELRIAARHFTDRLHVVPTLRHTHDLGFMAGCSYGQAWRLHAAASDADALVRAARNLADRFNPRVGMIRSWDFGDWRFPVIIDNVMNLELLFFAAAFTGEARFAEVARAHADRTIELHFRDDDSCFHLVDFDPATGNVLQRQTVQGYADDSTWARGQAWAIHGFAMLFRCTGRDSYLAQAVKAAEFFLRHPRLPADRIPYWDFDAPDIPQAHRDTSAAAVTASGLLELSLLVGGAEGARYRMLAEAQLDSLLSPSCLAAPETRGGFLLDHAVGYLPAGFEIDVPLAYADYYLLEAVMRRSRIIAGAPIDVLVSPVSGYNSRALTGT